MRPPLRIVLIMLGMALTLSVVAWTGTFFYWHFKLKAAFREIGEQRDTGYDTLRSAGCRALPYLVEALVTATDPADQKSWSIQLYFSVAGKDDPVGNSKLKKILLIMPDDPPPERKRKRDTIVAWWKNSGSDYHQWWRIWSSDCRR